MRLHLIKGKKNIGWYFWVQLFESETIENTKRRFEENRDILTVDPLKEYSINEIKILFPESKGKLRDSYRYCIDLDTK